MRQLFFLLTALTMASCNAGFEGDDAALDVASQWADAYFNCDFHEAANYATPESDKWLRFAASNITEKDVSYINEHNQEAKVEIVDRYMMAGDTTCSARIRVSDFVQLGFIEEDSKVIDQAEYQVTLVNRDGKWLVRMEGPLQSGK